MSFIESSIVLFVIILLGIVCGRYKLFNDDQIEGLQILLFSVITPCYLFISTISYNLSTFVDVNYAYSYLLSFSIVAFIIWCYFHDKAGEDLSKISIKILAGVYVNTGIYVIPIISFLFKDPRSAIFVNILQVVVVQSIFTMILNFRNSDGKKLLNKTLHSFVTTLSNPMIGMPIAGLLCNYLKLHPYIIITEVITKLGASSAGIALFVFGLTLSRVNLVKENFNAQLLFIAFTKNFLHPLVSFFVGKYLFNLESYWLYSLVIAASGPSAFVIYRIAKKFAIEEELVRENMALTTIFSLFSFIMIIGLLSVLR